MPPVANEQQFDAPKDRGPRRFATGEVPVMREFVLQIAEEYFDDRVVVPIASAAHAGLDFGDFQATDAVITSILHTPIRMMNPSAWRDISCPCE
jgi:hypothetical protein